MIIYIIIIIVKVIIYIIINNQRIKLPGGLIIWMLVGVYTLDLSWVACNKVTLLESITVKEKP